MSDDYVTAGGGMTFHLIFDAAADAAPASFRTGIEAAAKLLSQSIQNQITVNLNIDYSGTGDGAKGKPDNAQFVSYAPIAAADIGGIIGAVAGTVYAPVVGTLVGGVLGTVAGGVLDLTGLTDDILPSTFRQNIRDDLINSSGSNLAAILPNVQSSHLIQGAPFVSVANAQLKLFGLLDANDTSTDDGSATFTTDIPPDELVGVALHELTHAIGRVPFGPEPDIFDLFRFSSPGQLVFDGTSNPSPTSPAPVSYFSLDGGTTKLADYGTTSDPSDFLNTGVQGATDAFNEKFDANTNQYLTSIDLLQLEAIGFKARDPITPHLKFNLSFDASVSAAPAGFRDAVEAVAKYYEGRILDPLTINLTISYGALAPTVLGQSQASSLSSFSYDQIRTALTDDATTASDLAAALPAVDPISSAHTYVLDTAQQKALGLLDAANPATDGTVTFSNAANTFDFDRSDGIAVGLYDFAGTVAHEFSEIMGRTMDVGTTDAGFANSYKILDLYHYSGNGVRDLTKTPGYFSIDGGATNLDSFNSGTGDAADWAPSAGNDSFLNNSPPGVVNPVTAVDLQEIDVLGWNVLSAVSSAAELSADIKKIDLASQATGGDGTNYVITLKPGATLTEAADLFAVNLHGNDTLTIDGQGATLDGASAHRGLFIYSGAVTIQNLTIANAVARGGNGAFGGGGGGAGLGGGLFVASDTAHGAASSQVTLNNVVFQNDAAVGGTGGLSVDGGFFVGGGGGGGLGGDGASAGAFGGGSISTFPGGQGGGGGGGGVGAGAGFGAAGGGGTGGDAQTDTSHATPGGGGDSGANGLIPGATPGLFGFSGASLSLRDNNNNTYVAEGGPGGAAGNDGGGGGGGGGGAGGGAPAQGGPAWSGAGGGGEGGGVQGGGHAGYDADGGAGGFGGGGGGGVDFNFHIAPTGSARGSGSGGDGGFGGGGGGMGAGIGGFGGVSGDGGWGGGGGGGQFGGVGGFGGGFGNQDGGGGGLGAGGGIFVQQGASVTINGGSLSGGSVVKGLGADAGFNAGKAFGAGIFLQGNENITFAPAAGQKTVINDVITDETGSNGGGVGAAGKGSLTLDGPGTLDLTAANSFFGGVTIKQGTLEVGNQQAVRGNIDFAANGGGTLLIDASLSATGIGSLFAQINSFDSSSSFDFAGFDPTKTHANFVNNFGPALVVTDGVKTDVVDFPFTLDLTGTPFYVAPDGAGGSIVSLRPAVTVSNPAINIVEFVNGQDADSPTGPHVAAGSTVTFTYVVTDTGNVPLANVAVTDDKLGPITSFTGDTNGNGLLDLTETWTYTKTATALAGQQTNVATVTAQDSTNPSTTITDSNPTNYFGDNTPAISVDLSVTKTVSDATPNVGDQITFTVTLSDQSPDAATGVQVTDLLPAGLAFVSATPSQGTYNNGSGVWTVGTVNPGVPQTLGITATVVSPVAQTNTGTISHADQFDPNTANNTASATETPQQADLSVTKTVSDATPNVGDQITFTVTLSDQSPDAATGVQVTDLLPAGLAFVSATPSQGTFNNGSGVWTVGTVNPGVPQTLGITATVVSPVAQTNTGTISHADQFDPNTANNTASATETPQQADLSVTKTVSDATPNVGDQITFTVTLSDQSPDAATGVQVTDLLPAGLTFVSATPSQGTYDNGSGAWTVGTVSPGVPQTLSIIATVVSPAAQTNIGTIIHADQFDPNTTNNTASATETPQQADLSLVKFVNGQDADSATGPHVAAGSTVTFTYVVTNTGNVPLANVAVTDDKLGPITSFTGDANSNGLLDLTETWTYTQTAIALAGQQTNIGTVTAQDPNTGTPLTDNNPANYFGDPSVAPSAIIVSSGVTSTGLTISGGITLEVLSGGTASSTTVSGGSELVFGGGATIGTNVVSGGQENILAGATATGGSISDSGSLLIDAGKVSGITLNSGAVALIQSGGTATGTTISGGIEVVSGTTSSTRVLGGGLEYVASGGLASSVVVSSGGTGNVGAGGTASGATISSGGVLIDGGAALAVALSSGAVAYVQSGGTASGMTVSGGAAEVVRSGGVTNGTMLSGGAAAVSGTALNTTVGSGSVDYIASGGVDDAVAVLSGGQENVAAGGSVSGGTVSGGGSLLDAGQADVLLLLSGAAAYVQSGGVASSLTVGAGAADVVSSGGVASSTVLSGGAEAVFSGGSAVGATVSSGGVEYVASGGAASSAVVASGGQENIASGGVASGTVIGSGGLLLDGGTASGTVMSSGAAAYIESGGVAVGTVLRGGAVDVVLSGGVASGTVFSGGGIEAVFSGGMTLSALVASGGLEYVASGGTASAAVISGGTLEVTSGGSTGADPVTFALGGGGTLQLDDSVHFGGLVAGFGLPDFIDFRDVTSGASTTLGWTQLTPSSGTLAVTDGVHSASITLLGQYVAGQFTSASDGMGGTKVGDPPVVAMTDPQTIGLINPHVA